MELYRCVPVALTLLGLFVPVFSASLPSCPRPPPCGQGLGLKNCRCVRCLQDQYWVVKSRLPLCERCTGKCSGDRNLKEVIPCGSTQNRVCHCDKGFFCESKAQFSCRRCEHCPAGTFSSKVSMEVSCQPYTDCAGLGLTLISNGTSIQDQLCTSSVPSPRTDPPLENAPFFTRQLTIPLPVTTHDSRDTSQLPSRTATAVSRSTSEGFFEEYSSSFTSLLVLVAVLLAASMLVVCCMWHRHHLLKRKGWPFLKHLQVQGRKEDAIGGDLYFVSQGLLGSKTGNEQQVGPPKQQVTTDHSGGGDSVSNTVGSIYIYSPRMVVLGANTAERREEVEPPGEGRAHLGAPHQEQGPVEPPGTACVQEEEGKELSYPVPATSK